MQKALIATIVLVGSASAAFAVPAISAPEIDAAAGVAAVAALGGVVAMVRERFKR